MVCKWITNSIIDFSSNNLSYIVFRVKTTLLQTLVCRAGLQRFANVLFCGRDFFLCAGEKKQNKFPSNCIALSTEYQSSQSVFCNYFLSFFIVSTCRVGFIHLLTTAGGVASVGERTSISSPTKSTRTGENVPRSH